MRTAAEVRAALGVAPKVDKDSLYKPVKRVTRRFNKLNVPKSLQEALPYKSKPKQDAKLAKKRVKKSSHKALRAVVVEPEERQATKFMQQVQTMYNERERKRKRAAKERREKHEKNAEREDAQKAAATKQVRKKRYVKQGLEEKRKAGGAKASGND